ncbi:MAG: prepilin-type cleavage/methylation domain-containing protein [Isosphaera sp.]|nr:prepilin-type cleavage/methylation domain-containing protein [Isosphaera sp.]
MRRPVGGGSRAGWGAEVHRRGGPGRGVRPGGGGRAGAPGGLVRGGRRATRRRRPPRCRLRPPRRRGARPRRAPRRGPGFTLIELLVVIAIIAILVGLLLPAVQKVREAAARATCQNNLKQLGTAAHNYHSERGTLPPGYEEFSRGARYRGNSAFAFLLPQMEQGALASRWTYDDPFLMVLDGTSGTNGGPPRPNSESAAVIKSYVCPSDQLRENPFVLPLPPGGTADGGHWSHTTLYGFYGATSYAGNQGTGNWLWDAGGRADGVLTVTEKFNFSLGSFEIVGGVFRQLPGPKPVRLTAITDGTSTTILFGEKYHFDPNFDRIPVEVREYDIRMWAAWSFSGSYKGAGHVLASSAAPVNYQTPAAAVGATTYAFKDLRLSAYGSGHPGGVNVCMADGSVRFLANSTPPEVLRNLSTRAGGEARVE